MRKKVTNEDFVAAYGHLNTDPKQLTPTQRDNRNIMHSVTNKYSSVISLEDLHSCALKALWRCLGYHEDGHGQKFTTSLWRFTDWECKRELLKCNQERKKAKVISTEDITENFDIEGPDIKEDVQDLKECIKLLKHNDKELIQQYYFDRRTMEEIGSIHGYSKEAARQKISRAVSNLRKIFLRTK